MISKPGIDQENAVSYHHGYREVEGEGRPDWEKAVLGLSSNKEMPQHQESFRVVIISIAK